MIQAATAPFPLHIAALNSTKRLQGVSSPLPERSQELPLLWQLVSHF